MTKKENQLWAKGSFVQECRSDDEERMKTFHKKHDEDMNFNCTKCKAKISAHNNDWHDGMCDKCFNDKYFPND